MPFPMIVFHVFHLVSKVCSLHEKRKTYHKCQNAHGNNITLVCASDAVAATVIADC